MNQPDYTLVQRFFWMISGSEIHVLKDCKHDYNRHATMGFILFMTWLFATFAGGFAGWYFSHSLKPAFGFGILWGLMVYAIDRGMVISLKKNPKLDEQPFWFPFLTRALLGIIIAFFISIPLEILIFNEDIKIQMEKDKDSELGDRLNTQNAIFNTQGQENKISVDKSESDELGALLITDCPLPNYKTKLNEYNTCKDVQLPPLKAKYETSKSNVSKMYLGYKNNPCENYTASYDSISGKYKKYLSTCYSSKDWEAINQRDKAKTDRDTKSSECATLKEEAEMIKSAYYYSLSSKKSSLDSSITTNKNKLAETTNKIDSVKVQYETMLSELNGFTRQYVALNNAANSSGSLLFLMWLVRLGFFVIEILPTMYKLKTPIGDYERAIYYRERMFDEELVVDLESKRESELYRKTSNAEIARVTEEHRKKKEVELNITLIDEVARVQTEIATSHLKEWEKRETESSVGKVTDFIDKRS